ARVRVGPDVKEECIFLEWWPAHQLQFITGDPFQRVFEQRAVPVSGVDNHSEMSVAIIEFKLFEFSDFHRRIDKRIVARRGERVRLATGGELGDRDRKSTRLNSSH